MYARARVSRTWINSSTLSLRGRGSTLNKMIMTMQEEDRTLQSDETPSPKISEGLIITRDKNHPATEQIGSAKRARRRGKDN